MAGGESSDCHIVPTRDSHIFRFRVRLPSPDDCLRSSSTTVVAGRKYVAGYHTAPMNTHIKFSLTNVSQYPVPEAAAKLSTHMVLLDKTGSPAPSMGIGKTFGMSIRGFMVRGYSLKAERGDIKANCMVDKDNNFDVLCSVDIEWTPPASPLEGKLLDLGHDLAIMSDNQEHTDVSFDVAGETFSAHRVVLAARSPVFKAELYGPMAESKMASITIEEMEPTTFRSMLHYLYHGSLPDAGKTNVCFRMLEYQHLLIAADRYGIERLKKICEHKLSGNGITIDNVVSMLELAEDHVCTKLKARCFDFLADGENFMKVATSGEYISLMQSFPNLLDELRNAIKIVREKPSMLETSAHKKARLC
ncbi:BTB/POZ and MATH domain-containing protein 1-like [Lolium perenne]|uniref:BTB/POZ and MATH domain-containing protein 1-like n=1 Tax=Lolium perenne TaxID=4522 RepID=UPI0021F64A0C|nr:BTB/POZ and MATH domain-containing protein 1-like [Lolium perenne]